MTSRHSCCWEGHPFDEFDFHQTPINNSINNFSGFTEAKRKFLKLFSGYYYHYRESELLQTD
ncbi:MAG: hypothetical protein KAH64_00195, partial [Nitrosomonadaceae bacterium]|nr:hypothetical protein [Nitrosomonadaceae bacterium]